MTTPKKLPILFSGPLVRKILADEKTQTRRLMRPQPELHPTEPGEFWWPCAQVRSMVRVSEEPARWLSPYGDPPGKRVPGGRLWVRESFAIRENGPYEYPEVIYRADREARHFDPSNETKSPPFYVASDWEPADRWRPSIHMPRWASRITLEVTDVRVERVQDITAEDVRAEGVEMGPMPGKLNGEPATITYFDPRIAFAHLWNTINGKRPGASWEANPWVWVVSFRRLP